MRRFKKLASVLLVGAMLLALSTAAFAAGTEKKMAIESSKDGYMTVSGVTSEKQVGYQTVYYAEGPVKVSFHGSDIARHLIVLSEGTIITDTEILEGNGYEEIRFAVSKYRSYGDDKVYDALVQPPEDECVYLSGNYAVLEKEGIYCVMASPAAVASTFFYVVVTAGAPAPEAPAKEALAGPTAATVLVNGVSRSFDAYNINGSNYFKLRDLALVLSGTDKQFEVSWDEAARVINLVSGSAYSPVGGEMTPGDGKTKTATLNASPIFKDGQSASLTAYTINGNNYFKLRDLGQAFDFGVSWDDTAKTIRIDSATGYTAE